jgi:hypothetical protein
VFHGCGGLVCGLRKICDKRFRNIVAEMDVRKTVRCEIKEQWRKIGIYAIKYKEKFEMIVRKHEVNVKLSLCLTN